MGWDDKDDNGSPVADAARLAALAAYDIVDTAPEPEFDDIVAIAAHICRTPVALVSLVERDRQWFKARIGTDLCETPIGQSVCAHGLGSTDLLVIPDLTADPRTAANTLVTEEPRIRFYAGAPLVTPAGTVIGMLCVIDVDVRPEGLDPEQGRMLLALARQVVTQLELRYTLRLSGDALIRGHADHLRENQELRTRYTLSRLAQEAGGVGTFELDLATNRMKVSAEFCRLFGVPVQLEYDAHFLEDLIEPEDRAVRSSDTTRADGSASLEVEYRIRRADTGARRWIARNGEFLRDPDGKVIGMYGMVRDVTDQRILNDEIGHRLRNTLALVQAISAHTLRGVAERAPVEEFDRRIGALGAAHEVLLRRSTFGAPLADATREALVALGAENRVTLSGPPVELGPQTVLALTMLVHEMATNAMKHGALTAEAGAVDLRWWVEGAGDTAELHFEWTERGGPPARQPTRRGFGIRLLERGIGGGKVVLAYEDAGFSARMRAPLAQLAA